MSHLLAMEQIRLVEAAFRQDMTFAADLGSCVSSIAPQVTSLRTAVGNNDPVNEQIVRDLLCKLSISCFRKLLFPNQSDLSFVVESRGRLDQLFQYLWDLYISSSQLLPELGRALQPVLDDMAKCEQCPEVVNVTFHAPSTVFNLEQNLKAFLQSIEAMQHVFADIQEKNMLPADNDGSDADHHHHRHHDVIHGDMSEAESTELERLRETVRTQEEEWKKIMNIIDRVIESTQFLAQEASPGRRESRVQTFLSRMDLLIAQHPGSPIGARARSPHGRPRSGSSSLDELTMWPQKEKKLQEEIRAREEQMDMKDSLIEQLNTDIAFLKTQIGNLQDEMHGRASLDPEAGDVERTNGSMASRSREYQSGLQSSSTNRNSSSLGGFIIPDDDDHNPDSAPAIRTSVSCLYSNATNEDRIVVSVSQSATPSALLREEDYVALCNRVQALQAENEQLQSSFGLIERYERQVQVLEYQSGDLRHQVESLQAELALYNKVCVDQAVQVAVGVRSRQIQTTQTMKLETEKDVLILNLQNNQREPADFIAVNLFAFEYLDHSLDTIRVSVSDVVQPAEYRRELYFKSLDIQTLEAQLSIHQENHDSQHVARSTSPSELVVDSKALIRSLKAENTLLSSQVASLKVSIVAHEKEIQEVTEKYEAKLKLYYDASSDVRKFDQHLSKMKTEVEEAASEKILELQKELSAVEEHHRTALERAAEKLNAEWKERMDAEHRLWSSLHRSSVPPSSKSVVPGTADSVALGVDYEALSVSNLENYTLQQRSPGGRPHSSPYVRNPRRPSDRPSSFSGYRRKIRNANGMEEEEVDDATNVDGLVSPIVAHPNSGSLLDDRSLAVSNQEHLRPSTTQSVFAEDMQHRVTAKTLLHRAFEVLGKIKTAVQSVSVSVDENKSVDDSIRKQRFVLKQTLKMLEDELVADATMSVTLSTPLSLTCLFDILAFDCPAFATAVGKLLKTVTISPEALSYIKRRGDAVPILAQLSQIVPFDACHIIRQIAVHDDLNALIVNIGLLKHIMTALIETQYLEQQKDALRAIIAIGFTDIGKEAVRKVGAIPVIVKLSRRSDLLRPLVAQSLMVLSSDSENRIEIRRRNGIDLLISILSSASDVPSLRFGSGALLNLSVNEKNKELIRVAGGLPVLLTLVLHSDAHVRQYALRTLSNLILVSANAAELAESPFVESVVKCLTDQDANVVSYAARLLALACTEERLLSAMIIDGLTSICLLLQHTSPRVLDDALALLPQLCMHEAPREVLFRDGHLPKIVSILKAVMLDDKLESAETIASRRASTLSILCYVSTVREAVPQLIRLGLPSMCFQLMYHSSSFGVYPHRLESIYLLANLSVVPELCADIPNNSRLLQVIQLFEEPEAPVVAEAVRFMGNVVPNSSVRAMFYGIDGLARLYRLFTRKEVSVILNCVKLITELTKDIDALQSVLQAPGVLELLVRCLRYGKPELTRAVLQFIRNNIFFDRFRNDTLELQIIECLLDLVVLDDPVIQKDTLSTLQAYCGYIDCLDEFIGAGGLDVFDDLLAQTAEQSFQKHLMDVLIEVSKVSEFHGDILRHPKVFSILETWSTDATGLQIHILRLLCSLAASSNGRDVIIDMIPQKLLMHFIGEAVGDKHAMSLSLFARICFDRDSLLEMVHNGGLPLFLSALRKSEDPVKLLVLRTLISVASFPGGAAQIARRDGVNEVYQCLNKVSPALHNHAVLLMSILSNDATACMKVASYDMTLCLPYSQSAEEKDAIANVAEFALQLMFNIAKIAPRALSPDPVLQFIIKHYNESSEGTPAASYSAEVIKTLKSNPVMNARISAFLQA
eukprot:ANDGO_02025.mRNA.1 Vacuolar protein 8